MGEGGRRESQAHHTLTSPGYHRAGRAYAHNQSYARTEPPNQTRRARRRGGGARGKDTHTLTNTQSSTRTM